LRLALRDRGPGLPPTLREGAMGLAGLRDRVESLGGTFLARTREGGGTEIAMTLETGGPA
jgi:signal transduction histidine kinase